MVVVELYRQPVAAGLGRDDRDIRIGPADIDTFVGDLRDQCARPLDPNHFDLKPLLLEESHLERHGKWRIGDGGRRRGREYELFGKTAGRSAHYGHGAGHIVMPDADIDNAVNALTGAAYGSCGERCMAISVAVCIGDETADEVVGKLQERLNDMKVGNGNDISNDMGPLVTKPHHDKVRDYVDLGVEEGAELVVDGRGLVVDGHENGFFLGPCLFDKVTQDMRIYQEEIFGPVLCVVRAESEEQAMQLIDDHEYGNGTCIFTRDGEAARYFADNIKVGMVGINVPLPVPVAYHSFGGWKRSLFGDLFAYGPDSVRFYTRRKTITQRWPSGGVREKAQFSFPSNQ